MIVLPCGRTAGAAMLVGIRPSAIGDGDGGIDGGTVGSGALADHGVPPSGPYAGTAPAGFDGPPSGPDGKPASGPDGNPPIGPEGIPGIGPPIGPGVGPDRPTGPA
jgi:hypothetical protein